MRLQRTTETGGETVSTYNVNATRFITDGRYRVPHHRFTIDLGQAADGTRHWIDMDSPEALRLARKIMRAATESARQTRRSQRLLDPVYLADA